MKELFQKKKRGLRRRISIVMILAMLFSILPTDLVLFKLPMDTGKNVEAAGSMIIKGVDGSHVIQYSNGEQHDMMSLQETFGVDGANYQHYKWELVQAPDPNSTDPVNSPNYAITFNALSANVSQEVSNSTSVTVRAHRAGVAQLTLSGWNDVIDPVTGTTVADTPEVFTMDIRIGTRISRSLTAKAGYYEMDYVNSSARKRSLIFSQSAPDPDNPGTFTAGQVTIGQSGATQSLNELNLLFVNGRGESGKKVTWKSANEDILKVLDNDSDGTVDHIVPVGAGHTTLHVTVEDDPASANEPEKDDIDVYVKPRVKIGKYLDEASDGATLSGDVEGQTFTLKDGAYISIENLRDRYHDEITVNEKVDWVAYRQEDGKNYLVKDSLGNVGEGYDDDAITLTYVDTPPLALQSGETKANKINAYKFSAEPGTYRIRFYPKGAYEGIGNMPELTKFDFIIKKESAWENKEVTLDIGGHYDVAEALDIPAATLRQYFKIEPSQELGEVMNPTNVVYKGTSDPTTLYASDSTEGTAVYYVWRSSVGPDIPGVPTYVYDETKPTTANARIRIKITVKETFRISTSMANMYTTQELTLDGIIGMRSSAPSGSLFAWNVSFKASGASNPETYLSLTPEQDPYDSSKVTSRAVIKALKETPSLNALIVTLYWTAPSGITQKATCEITIKDSANKITFADNVEDPIKLEVGESKDITVNIDTGSYEELEWKSAKEGSSEAKFEMTGDEDIGSRTRSITGKAVGRDVLMIINKNNGVVATREVVVVQRMDSLTIVAKDSKQMKATTYNDQPAGEVSISEGYLDLGIDYTPATATETDVVWSISEALPAGIASIGAQTGKLSFTGLEGWVKVRVEAADNAKRIDPLYAELWIHIAAKPMTAITLKHNEIWVIKGQTEKIEYAVTPEDAYDKDNVVCKAGDDGKYVSAQVNKKDGVIEITGVSATAANDLTTVTVSCSTLGTKVEPQTIKVHVAEPLTGIKFEKDDYTVKVGEKMDIGLVYDPKENVDKGSVTLSSVDPDIATIQAKTENGVIVGGVVKGVKYGTVTIFAMADELGITKMAKCVVHVTVPLKEIKFDKDEYTVEVGKTVDIGLIYDPNDNVDKEHVTFTSEDPKTASVEAKTENGAIVGGVATGVKVGTVTIHAVTEELGVAGMISCKVHVVEPIIIADGFSIDPEKKTIKVGETFQIMSIFSPANPTDKTVEYKSSDESVATVSETGVVTGISVSDVPVMITCTYVPGNMIAICMVTVESKVKLKLSPTTKTILKGKSFTIKKTVTPSKLKNTPTQWKSSNTKVATVSQSGKVKTKKVGTCVITCLLVNYKVKATCTVKVTKLKTTIKLNKSSIRINVGQKYQLKSTVTTNDSKKPSVTYISRNKKVASVGSKTGKITGRKVGSAVIVARTTDSVRATAKCRVTVIRRASSLDLNKHYALCFIGGTIQLSAKITPSNASIKKLVWSTSDNTIASVDQRGKISGLKEGEIYINVKTTDGSNLSDRCFVRIIDQVPASSILLAQTKLTMKKGDTVNLTYEMLPKDTTDTITMASDNKRVVTVTNGGKITAVGTGTATITMMTTSGITNTVEVHVVDLNKSNLRIRQYDTETLVVTGADGTVTWYSENNRIAGVENGTITGRGIGTTYVYAYIDGCKLSCRVQVVSVNNEQR